MIHVVANAVAICYRAGAGNVLLEHLPCCMQQSSPYAPIGQMLLQFITKPTWTTCILTLFLVYGRMRSLVYGRMRQPSPFRAMVLPHYRPIMVPVDIAASTALQFKLTLPR